MYTMLALSVFWICYGILGLFGVQKIPEKYRNAEFAKDYKRFSGTGWLLLGLPQFILWIVIHNMDISPLGIGAIMLLCAIPAVVYAYIGEKKFRKQLEK